jgi:hypothetical protein
VHAVQGAVQGMGGRMSATSSPTGWRDSLRAWWWLPVIAGVLAGLAVGVLAGSDVGRTTSAVVNVRAASTLPNERLDLINDLGAITAVTEVVEPVAEAHGLTTSELREALGVRQVESSTQVRMSVTLDRDEDERRQVLEDFLDAVVAYLDPQAPSAALEAARAAEADAIAAYYQAIEDNGGVAPPDELRRLEQRIVQQTAEGNRGRAERLRRFLPTVIRQNREFAELVSARDRATTSLEELTSADLLDSSRGPGDLRLSFVGEGADPTTVTSSLAVRRGGAAGLAVALVVAVVVAVAGPARRRRAAA